VAVVVGAVVGGVVGAVVTGPVVCVVVGGVVVWQPYPEWQPPGLVAACADESIALAPSKVNGTVTRAAAAAIRRVVRTYISRSVVKRKHYAAFSTIHPKVR
jgi:hypothetical protein